MKAILVIDMPKDCWDCPLHRDSWNEDNEEIMICRGTYMESHYGEKPDWCPLKPIPQKLDAEYQYDKFDGDYFEQTKGYNTCIDDLLGETNESDS